MKRSDFKRNFLKEIIIRLDFQGVFQSEMEKVLIEAKSVLKDQQFNGYDEKISSTSITDSEGIKNIQNQTVYVFTSDSCGYTVSLSTSYLILSVRCSAYSSFEKYSSIFISLANIFKEKIDFFTVKRLGIRKINQCQTECMNDVSTYLNSKYYDSNQELENYSTHFRERREHLVGDESFLNLVYIMGLSNIEGKDTIQIVFDSDVYMDNPNKIENTLYTKKHLDDLNDTLFSVYVNILTEEFKQILMGNKDIPTNIIGVEENE